MCLDCMNHVGPKLAAMGFYEPAVSWSTKPLLYSTLLSGDRWFFPVEQNLFQLRIKKRNTLPYHSERFECVKVDLVSTEI